MDDCATSRHRRRPYAPVQCCPPRNASMKSPVAPRPSHGSSSRHDGAGHRSEGVSGRRSRSGADHWDEGTVGIARRRDRPTPTA
jgi:hypothetical protein